MEMEESPCMLQDNRLLHLMVRWNPGKWPNQQKNSCASPLVYKAASKVAAAAFTCTQSFSISASVKK